jgi:2-phospho-L-lactate guanylyltransferase
VRWLAVVPIKPLPAAKTRLRGAVPDEVHPELVLAMARDTVAAVLACPLVERVVVVCDDPDVESAMKELGAQIVPDVPGGGLNAAVEHGTFDRNVPRFAVTADLPALKPHELGEALQHVGRRAAFVPDAEGTGTVLLAAPRRIGLRPRFGVGSAEAHRRAGALPLDGPWPGLRRDVDTADNLDEARLLGVGPHTESLMRCRAL